jgi:putative SOS response-associated peptidase YedK
MCGRFTLRAPADQLAMLFGLSSEPVLVPRYNIAPTQPVGLVRVEKATSAREWALAIWGLIPSWAKDPSIGARMINARSETVAEKPSFRAAYKRRRCLIPADGFYEWQKLGSRKQPYLFDMADGAPFAFAGLWEHWIGADGSELETCTILTTAPNQLVERVHNRMPVIVDPFDYEDWLGSGGDDPRDHLAILPHLLRPFDAGKMKAVPVSTYVSNSRNEGEKCVEPIGPAIP